MEGNLLSSLCCFPCVESTKIFDSNIPAMDEFFFLVKQADESLHDSQLFLDNQDLFGSMRGVTISDCKDEMDEVFGETNTERNDEILRHEFFCYFFLKKSNIFYYFTSAMTTITMNSHLGMQFYLLGISGRIG